jgi:hypothetical protein
MSALSIEVPFPVFQDRDGQPLENGYIFLGVANLNPQVNPVIAYFDEALTIPAAQPLRTINGYISNAGTPAQVYVDAVNFSILVQDSKGSMVYSFPDGTGISPDACGVTYDPPFTGGVAYPVCEKLEQTVSVKDFGAVGDGVSDDTAAILTAISASSGKQLVMPAGTYLVSSEIAISVQCSIEGQNPFATIIRTNNPTANIFKCTSGNVQISGIGFESSVTRSGGSYLDTNSQSNVSLTNFKMTGAYRGVTINGGAIINISSAGKIADIRETIATTGRGIYITGTCFAVSLFGIVMDSSGVQPEAGIYIDSSADVTMNTCNIIRQRIGMLIVPSTGQTVDTVWATNCYFDTSTGGVQIAPTNNGNVKNIKFNACWLASHTGNGIDITGSASATISGVHLIDCECKVNGLAGLSVSNGVGLRDVQVIGGLYGNNASGISFATAVTEFVIMGATLGRGGGVNGNSVWGAVFNGAVSNCVITNNVAIGNGSGSITFVNAPGAGVQCANNAGFNPEGYATITVGASPFTYTAGNTSENIMINQGTVSLVAVNGNNVFQSSNVSVYLSAGDTLTVTYSSAPGISKYRI